MQGDWQEADWQGQDWQGVSSQGQDRHSQYPQGAGWQGQGSQEVDWQGVGLQGQNREGGRTYHTGLSSIKEGDNVRYYLYNHRGDTVLVTGGDGEIIHNLSYEAYGKATDKLGYPAGSVNIETSGGSDAWGGGSGSGWGASRGATSGGGAGGGGSESFGGSAGATSGGESFGGGADSSGGGESFGGGAGSSNNRGSVFPQLFAGAYGIRYDAKTNLHYMRYRWYSQTQMRFISLDLIRNANRYSYTNGNPIMYVDPTGLEEEAIGGFDENNLYFIQWDINYRQIRRQVIKDEKLSKGQIDIKKRIFEEIKSIRDKREKMPIIAYGDWSFGNSGVVHCELWVQYFIDYHALENKDFKNVVQTSNLNKLKDSINNGIGDIKVERIEAYYGNTDKYYETWNMETIEFIKHPYFEKGHHYVYLRFVLNDETEMWILTETNATGAEGKNFGIYLIEEPKNFYDKSKCLVPNRIKYIHDNRCQ